MKLASLAVVALVLLRIATASAQESTSEEEKPATERRSPALMITGIAVMGIGVGNLVAGLVLLGSPDDQEAAAGRLEPHQKLGVGMMIAGPIVALGGGALLVVGATRVVRRSTSLDVVIGPRSVAVRSAF
jgi:hypothetical protein